MLNSVICAALSVMGLVLASSAHANSSGQRPLTEPAPWHAGASATGSAVSWRDERMFMQRDSQIVLPGEQIERMARGALREWLSQQADRFELEILSAPTDVQMAQGPLTLRVRPIVANLDNAPEHRVLVWVELIKESQLLRSIAVEFDVQVHKRILPAPDASKVTRYEVPVVSHLQTQKRSLSNQHFSTLVPDKLAIQPHERGPIVARAFPATQALIKTPVQAAPEVLRGHSVSLSLRTGDIVLERLGMALENGRIGQLVPVRLPGMTTPLLGKVIGEGRLDVPM